MARSSLMETIAAAVRNMDALFLVYRDPLTDEIKHAWAGIAGRDGIKPLVFYTLNAAGQPVECAAAGDAR